MNVLSSMIVTLYKIQKGLSGARSDDTKSLKGPILDWIAPVSEALNPPLGHNIKINCGFHHERTGELLCPAGLDWSVPEYAQCSSPNGHILTIPFPRINQQLRSGEMMVPGDQWPMFLFAKCSYNPEDPWKGLFFRSSVLVLVSVYLLYPWVLTC